jgi:hypothetical protein
METAARYETKVILKDIRREGWQWREYVERRVGVEKVSWSPNKPPLSEVFKLNASKLNVRNCLESMEKQVLSGTDVLLAKLPSLKSSADRVNASDNERA